MQFDTIGFLRKIQKHKEKGEAEKVVALMTGLTLDELKQVKEFIDAFKGFIDHEIELKERANRLAEELKRQITGERGDN